MCTLKKSRAALKLNEDICSADQIGKLLQRALVTKGAGFKQVCPYNLHRINYYDSHLQLSSCLLETIYYLHFNTSYTYLIETH